VCGLERKTKVGIGTETPCAPVLTLDVNENKTRTTSLVRGGEN
jgi:hypothetical protein